MSCKQPHVLSIQSHVVSGYVGNKSATFPLQLLGFDVDTINSVQLSNHTGYKVFKGQVLNDQDLTQLVDGLAENELDNYSHLLTGYVGSASFLNRIAQLVKALKIKNPNLVYVCDPVLGDNGHMYVPEELKNIYKNDILPLADIITPNQFELELLTGLTIKTMSELKEAIKVLHSKGPKIVAVSSTDIENKLTSVTSVSKDNTMIKIEVPRIPAIYTGSGDLFAALLLAHTYLEDDIKISLEKTINTLFEVLEKTYHHSLTIKEANAQQAKKIELRLIQSKKNIENPNILLRAVNF
ncbi:pyridoxal kinase isoform X1 [Belonocnema kinseyi]|uniref:pyridoxal kinase isoform X1 n=1 Tax=Belonocnema kinseyi TaxID=2817044 RepID=UPI00143DC8DF|nr:pyridoxal kinase isoform X1 [Belonocnema kinseyi]